MALQKNKNAPLTSFGDWNWCCSLTDVEEPISVPYCRPATQTALVYP